MRPDLERPEYVGAFNELTARIAEPLKGLPKRMLPIRMYVAGGAALHFYTGERTQLPRCRRSGTPVVLRPPVQ